LSRAKTRVLTHGPGNPIIRRKAVTMENREQIGKGLILDELFDLSLYRELRKAGGPGMTRMLDELIEVEITHFAFWQEFFKLSVDRLDWKRRIKLRFIHGICRVLGESSVDMVLEAIEVYGVRKYLSLWKTYKDEPMGAALRGILRDEFEHEDTLVSRLQGRIISPDRIRNVFLGLNDGIIEILGAVSGFFASFGQNRLVLVAGLTTAVAGSLSMAAGAFVAASSENEVRKTQDEKTQFLGHSVPHRHAESAIGSAAIVGGSYFGGAALPLLPVMLGAHSPLYSIAAGGTTVLLVSVVLAFLSGMQIRKRTLINLALILLAAGITYAIGTVVKSLLGVEI
jgi:VIT1/CCC1 family predicted Fe2+/Mn2+ transporter